jgi:iron complex transport system substrate-binding protein
MDNPTGERGMPGCKTKSAVISLAVIIFVLVGFMWLACRPVKVERPSFSAAVRDDLGRNVTLSKLPQRIVSLAPSNTEILFALGLGPKVIGVTRFCDYPPEAREGVNNGSITVIGGFADPSLEVIVALNPDLVLAASKLQEKVVRDLEEKGLTVIALNPKKVDQVLAAIRLVGRVCGRSEEAESLANRMEQVISAVRSKAKTAASKPRVYYEVWHEPLYTIGPTTLQSELIEMAGGVNIFSDAKAEYPIVSSEAVIERDPEIIIVPTGYMGGVNKEDFEKRPGWSTITAVKNGRIYQIDENIVIRPGPRIVQGLQQLAKLIHPEIFGSNYLLLHGASRSPRVVTLEASQRFTSDSRLRRFLMAL